MQHGNAQASSRQKQQDFHMTLWQNLHPGVAAGPSAATSGTFAVTADP